MLSPLFNKENTPPPILPIIQDSASRSIDNSLVSNEKEDFCRYFEEVRIALLEN